MPSTQHHTAPGGPAHAFAAGYAHGLLVAAALALVAAVVAVVTLREPRRDASSQLAMSVAATAEAA